MMADPQQTILGSIRKGPSQASSVAWLQRLALLPSILLRILSGFHRTLLAAHIIDGKQRSMVAVVLFTVAIFFIEYLLTPALFQNRTQPVLPDHHATISLEMAAHQHRYGTTSVIVNHPDIPTLRQRVTRDAEVLVEPILDMPGQLANSEEEYVAGLRPFRNNENSLMLFDYAVLWLWPQATLQDLVRAHLMAKLACLVLFTAFLLRAGLSPILSFAAFHLAVAVVLRTNETNPISVYSFLLPMVLLLVALLGFALSLRVYRSKVVEIVVLLCIGMVAGFAFHIRTSYVPVGLALILLYAVIAALALDRLQYRRRWSRCLAVILPVVCFLAGVKAYTHLLIQPVRDASAEASTNYDHHAIAHPLVLGVALPPNDFAKQQGIEWRDAVGLDLARRIDPNIQYLDANYEKALFVFYFKLWLFHPEEMKEIYRNKLELNGECLRRYLTIMAPQPLPPGVPESIKVAFGERLTRWLIRVLKNQPLGLLPRSGTKPLLFFTILAIVPLFLRRWLHPGSIFVISATAAVGVLLQMEAGLILSEFYVTYHAYVLFSLLFVGLLCYQVTFSIPVVLATGVRLLGGRISQWGTDRPRAEPPKVEGASTETPPLRMSA